MKLDQLSKHYDMCKTTLKETSKDEAASMYMTESQLEVYNFDHVKERYYQKYQLPKGEKISSCDALYLGDLLKDEHYLIEFRNMNFENISKGRIRGEIKEKLSGSLLILTDIIQVGISQMRQTTNFLLVYNDQKGRISAEISKRVNSKSNDFNLRKYEHIYYKQCLILDKNEFQKQFVNQWENGDVI